MRRRPRRQVLSSRLDQQDSNIFFDLQTEGTRNCAICYKRGHHLVKPCLCNTGYHEPCLLLFIQRRIQRQLREKEEMDLSTLKCMVCHHRFHVLFRHHSEKSCRTLCQRLSRNCCNRYVVLSSILMIIMIVTVTLWIYYLDGKDKGSTGLKYGLASALVVQVLILIVLIYGCLDSFMTRRRLVLSKVLQLSDLRSLQSQSSDEMKVNDEEEVVIQS